jgi:tryptophan-rich sensory protein
MATWYDNLKKPRFTPPKKAFGIVWSILYIFIITSLTLYFLAPTKPNLAATITLLIIHFTASFNWTGLFFKQKKILPALIDIFIIDTTLAAIILLFLQSSIPAALLLLPYLSWGLFATYLNWGIYRLNPPNQTQL